MGYAHPVDGLELLQKRLGYRFAERNLLIQALTHRSADRQGSYERLEFVGDALLGVIMAQWLFEQFPKASEGELTRMRATLVRQSSLAQIARRLQLNGCLRLGVGERKSGGQQRESILADVVEAIIGAMLQDGATPQQITTQVRAWFRPLMDSLATELNRKDPKTRLQEWLQARQQPLPVYHLLGSQGQPPHEIFTVACEVLGQGQQQASGASIRFAEQAAAATMLVKLGEQPDDLPSHNVSA